MSFAPPIRLVLVDNAAAVRRGLCAYLEVQEGIQVVAQCGERDSISTVKELQPDTIVLASDREELIRQLAAAAPGVKILGTLDGGPMSKARFIAAGGWDVVNRFSPVEDVMDRLLSCRENVHHGIG
ncbi:MAG: hypothetical protein HY319_27220 [Armatimonadetes bacterium]|nr:hypothetical protein [Armatimonadota bacterium]